MKEDVLHAIECDCEKCLEQWNRVDSMMKVKPIRLCIECGKQHDTGVENKLTGEFDRIDKCIDCLMSKCSFKFESSQITLDDMPHMIYDEMQLELGKTVCNVLQTEYGNKTDICVPTSICTSCEMYKNDHRTHKDLPCPDCGKYR